MNFFFFFPYEIKLLISTHYEMTGELEVRMTQGMWRSAIQNTLCEQPLIVAQLPQCCTRGDPQTATADNHIHLPSSPRFIPTLSAYLLVDLSSSLSPMKFPDHSFVRIYAVPSVSCMSFAHIKLLNSFFITMLGSYSGRKEEKWKTT